MSERLSDEELGEVERRISHAAAERWVECQSKTHADEKHFLHLALHGESERDREIGQSGAAELVERWLKDGDTAAVARFGRLADEAAHKGAEESDPPYTQEEQVYMAVINSIREKNHVPTKAELMSGDYGFPRRTVERCFQRIAESGNLRRVTKDGEEIWTPAPRS